jgi:hypothetical protein
LFAATQIRHKTNSVRGPNFLFEKNKKENLAIMANMNPNLADFKAEYKLNKALQSLTNLIAGAQQPNGQPIFPNEPGTPLNDIIRQYNLQPAEAPPPYDFGLDNHVTI